MIGSGCEVKLFDVRQIQKGSFMSKVKHQEAVTSCAFANDFKLITGSRDKSVRLWSLERDNQTVRSFSCMQSIDLEQQINSVSCSSSYCYIGCNDGHCAVLTHVSNNFESTNATIVAIGQSHAI